MTVQKHVRFDDDVVRLVDDWRRQQTPIPSFNTAINQLIRLWSVERDRRCKLVELKYGNKEAETE